ncbi:tRNA (N6-threonylcarbamoyladenosine(37)-N6)-methyltransferase TrmO [Ancylobacter mangrovi]|uniref:tRNA (N6-threonylcarbamoyladenosine(37)-N6)-methyltransferase TrmO n=1 Tax=Ancylobacter mangrovi TaxID=2972472 RepID=UPI0021635F0D|nr:tRNA (N6-threonylcarbamoyladenosine(37)-N6)-methyltransferase TrmO [Ancylobacter mangrovi]MCS0501695.1 tRNA (N6-threonylcarbamoyladenosine(37)-N6)-methyltransferase TrmO [Ancylobacter mangrovi]
MEHGSDAAGGDRPEGATDTPAAGKGASEFGVRPGEITRALPERPDAGLYFIGRLRTPWTDRASCPKNGRESEELCTVELDPDLVPALDGLEGTTHLWLLYWMDRAPRDLLVQVPRQYGRGRGTFALRSPARPNPIAMSAVRLVGMEGNRLSVIGLDCLDGTPLLDIKPYFASTDCHPEAVVGWHCERRESFVK